MLSESCKAWLDSGVWLSFLRVEKWTAGVTGQADLRRGCSRGCGILPCLVWMDRMLMRPTGMGNDSAFS